MPQTPTFAATSPEEDDMKLHETPVSPLAPEPGACAVSAPSMCCLASDYLDGTGSCERRIPQDVIEAAWRRTLEDGTAREGFFRVDSCDGQWLAYGHSDGEVRGVYCPEHAAGRDQRAVDAITRTESATPALQYA
jgi:hypothetical protein